MTTNIYIGKRLSFSFQLCTVRYHGPVEGTSGPWLGVEWDDPTRGKHSGEHLGKRYFTPLHPSPTSSSFIRPARRPDTPHTFVSALKSKYAPEEPVHSRFKEDPDVDIVFNQQPPARSKVIKFSGKPAEEIGFDKIRAQLAQLEELRIIILDGLCMWRPDARGKGRLEDHGGEKNDVKEACPKATDLDLSRNLFEEWREVVEICGQLGELRSLRVE
jgi:hypothetical protein